MVVNARVVQGGPLSSDGGVVEEPRTRGRNAEAAIRAFLMADNAKVEGPYAPLPGAQKAATVNSRL